MVLIEEAHKYKFLIHLGVTKMYQDSIHNYWWPCMKMDIDSYVEPDFIEKSRSNINDLTKKLQPLDISLWKWEQINMHLITKIPKTTRGFDTI